jgi:hypothetical protein
VTREESHQQAACGEKDEPCPQQNFELA